MVGFVLSYDSRRYWISCINVYASPVSHSFLPVVTMLGSGNIHELYYCVWIKRWGGERKPAQRSLDYLHLSVFSTSQSVGRLPHTRKHAHGHTHAFTGRAHTLLLCLPSSPIPPRPRAVTSGVAHDVREGDLFALFIVAFTKPAETKGLMCVGDNHGIVTAGKLFWDKHWIQRQSSLTSPLSLPSSPYPPPLANCQLCHQLTWPLLWCRYWLLRREQTLCFCFKCWTLPVMTE